MPPAARHLPGPYIGRLTVRPGREDELSSTERKQIEKRAPVQLEIHADGTYDQQVTSGTWSMRGLRVEFQPTHFGGQTEAEMRDVAASQARRFGLQFVFQPFVLVVEGDTLVTDDAYCLVFMEFRRG